MWDTQNMLEIKKISIQFPLILEHVALSQAREMWLKFWLKIVIVFFWGSGSILY